MLGGEDGRTLLMCAAPDFLEVNRAHTREAVLLTTRVQVPHAGLPYAARLLRSARPIPIDSVAEGA